MHSAWVVAAYLFAIVSANLAVATFGPAALPFTALVLIPFDLFSRDLLHERWHGRGLATRMGLLIASGSALAYALNASALRVGLASCSAFALAAIVDTYVYAALSQRSSTYKMAASNTVSSLVDSLVFPMVAFGSISPDVFAHQSIAKVAGGAFWVAVYVHVTKGTREHV